MAGKKIYHRIKDRKGDLTFDKTNYTEGEKIPKCPNNWRVKLIIRAGSGLEINILQIHIRLQFID